MPTIELEPLDLITVATVAIFVSMAVSAFIKPALVGFKSNQYYNLFINVLALVVGQLFAFLGMVGAQVLFTPSSIVMTFFRGFSAFFLAVAGYKGYKKIADFTSKVDLSRE